MDKLIDQLTHRLFVELEASGRHVHLTKEVAVYLFGHSLTPAKPLSQPGQFAAQERVTVRGPKGTMERVAVLGPERPECQVELSRTDCVALGIHAPLRDSGDVANTP
ncbi:MAG: propanediol utilization protein, partial [Oscillospiraceae bacterium]|nr:propanediol utilization protein [Oscillospiraceae bacterium]